MATGPEASADVATVVRGHRDEVEAALVGFDRPGLRDLGLDPDATVEALFTPAFVDANTDFADLEAFLSVAGVDALWDLAGWLGWVLDWHVLGNTRFWSWEWMVHAAVAVRAAAAAVGPVRCPCGGAVDPATGSAVEEPGRADGRWVAYRCGDCGATGRATLSLDDDATLEGLERA
jgi:hypothetical protein